NFLLLEARPRFHAGENRWLEEMPAFETIGRGALPAAAQFRSLGTADVDVALHLLHGAPVDQRTHVRPILAAVAQPKRPNALFQHLDEGVVNPVFQNEAARGRAALTGRAERAPQHSLARR